MDSSPVTLSVEEDCAGGEGPSMDGNLSRSSLTSMFIVHKGERNTHLTSSDMEEELRLKLCAVL